MSPGSQGEWLECIRTMTTSLYVSGGGRCCCVSMCTVWPSHLKWLSEQSNESAPNFALSLNIRPWNYSDDSEGHSYGKLVIGSFIMTIHLLTHHVSCRVFWWKIRSPRWLSALTFLPRFSALRLWASPQTKSPLKAKRFQTISEIQENMTGQLMWLGELCEVPRCLLWRGLRCHCPTYNVPCILYLLQ